MMKKHQIIIFALLNLLCILDSSAHQISVFEDLLYWHASQETASPWAGVQTPALPAGYSYYAPNVYFGWSPGVRAGIHYKTSHFLDARLYGTYFSTKAHEATTAPSGQFILPEFFNSLLALPETLFISSGKLSWRLTMNIIDIDIGHSLRGMGYIPE